MRRLRRHTLLLGFLLALLVATPGRTAETACTDCHGGFEQKKVAHAALQAGCTACHANLDASVTPHRTKGGVAHGLAAEPPDLCHGCHEKREFNDKSVHAPAASGLCMTCHDPHASDWNALSRRPPSALCLDCHPDVQNQPHVLAGFGRRGHPLGDVTGRGGPGDPRRPGKPFFCGSCHDPHSSKHARLLRFEGGSMRTFCQNCHKM